MTNFIQALLVKPPNNLYINNETEIWHLQFKCQNTITTIQSSVMQYFISVSSQPSSPSSVLSILCNNHLKEQNYVYTFYFKHKL